MRALLCLLVIAVLSNGQSATELQSQAWRASWVAPEGASPQGYGVYHFRRSFDLTTVPAKFEIHVSADQRYRLYLNGKEVSTGPARGDLGHWRFETVDLAPSLQRGKNTLAAVVWSQGLDAPIAQKTFRTGFLLMAADAAHAFVDTGTSEWRALQNPAYKGVPVRMGKDVYGYWAAGLGDDVDGSKYPWGWQEVAYDDAKWSKVVVLGKAAGRDSRDAHSRWMMVPRPIPQMERKPLPARKVRWADNVDPAPTAETPITIGANRQASILLDQQELVTGYLGLVVSGGAGSTIRVRYEEGLYEPKTRSKGNRTAVTMPDGTRKEMVGQSDFFRPDGGANRVFETLWWRTWRYAELTIETKDQPLTITRIQGQASMYPFEKRARFESPDQELQKILENGWRTARLCAHETYMDCPYYEQLQYVGDTRIQALVSLYETGDSRLMKDAIQQIRDSRSAEGLTYSRAPSELHQYIPGFSLWWIGMVHDYWRYVDDPLFVQEMLTGVRDVLSWYEARTQEDGSVRKLPWWPYVDWTREWKGGEPPLDRNGNSALHDLQLLLAYQYAADLESALGLAGNADRYRTKSWQLQQTIRRKYYQPEKAAIADNAEKSSYSQQAAAMAVLGGVLNRSESQTVMRKALEDRSFTEASIYFRAYVHDAVRESGLGDQYVGLLGEWRDQLKIGLTTTAERYEPSRSDTHAWGASPNYNVFKTILGIDSAAPGFSKVVIRPNLGSLEWARGEMPHPKGTIRVSLRRVNGKVVTEVSAPPGVTVDVAQQ